VPLVSDGADGKGKQDVVQSGSNKGENRQGGRFRKGGDAILALMTSRAPATQRDSEVPCMAKEGTPAVESSWA
jgi:hypothetical protein